MIKRSILFFLATVLVFGFTGCKYEEGPWFSLRSAERRLVNSWNYEFVQFNGANILNGTGPGSVNFSLSTIGFNEDGRFSASWRIRNDNVMNNDDIEQVAGSWSFDDDNETLVLDYDDMPERQQTFNILRLRNDDLWLEEKVDDDLFEYRLDGEE